MPENSITQLPSAENFENVSDKLNLILAFDRKAEILLKRYEKSSDKTDVKKALEQFTLIDSFIDAIEENTYEEQSQLHWRANASKAYNKAIRCAYILENPGLAFYFMEKSKALLLTESILKNNVAISLPKDLLKREKTFKKSILKLESDLIDYQNVNLEDSLFSLKFKYQKFTDSLKINFPEYYSNKSKTQLFSLEDTKKQLDPNTIVISYNWGALKNNNTIRGLVFSNVLTQFFTIDNADQLKGAIETYRQLLSKPYDTKKDSDNFKQVAHKLFTTLFPDKIKETIKNKHIIIVSDGDLQSVPFEALITKENSADYLIKTNEISYAYSMSFLLHNQSVKRETNTNFVGYAPVTFNDKNLNSLNQSKTEINAIHEIIGGEKHLNDSANKGAFLNKSSDSKIIHLATHAEVSSNPWIALSDDTVKLHELYTHKVNADLVVLSACNTSIGEVVQGEGVMSLARGFFYSGANSVISTLWNVNDKSNAAITTSFYTYLKRGKTKSTALRQAKLDYINSHSLSEASPYYWSSLILIGDDSSVKLSSNNWIYYILGLLIVVLIFFFYRKFG